MTIQIETGHEIPRGHQQPESNRSKLMNTIRSMQPGQSFIWKCNKAALEAAKAAGAVVVTRKMNGEGYRVWKVK